MKKGLILFSALFFIFSITSCPNEGEELTPVVEGWLHEAYLKAPNYSNEDYYSYAVAADGNTVVVGAYNELSGTQSIINSSDLSGTNDDSWSSGAVYVYVKKKEKWAFQAYLKAPNSGGGDYFGWSVAIDGDTIVVGAPNEDSSTTAIINASDLSTTNNDSNSAGAAYVYVRSGAAWTFQSYLKAPAILTMEYDDFGYSVAIDADTIVIGAPYEDSDTDSVINGDSLTATEDQGDDVGAAYVFVRSGTSWSHEAYLKSSDPSPVFPIDRQNDYFGQSVDISGETIVVGSPREDSGTQAILSSTDYSSIDETATDAGSATIFVRSGTTWSHEAYLKAPNADAHHYFGHAVSILVDTLCVGAYGEESDTTEIIAGADLSTTNDDGGNVGAVYIFTRSTTTWIQEAYLKSSNSTGDDEFGYSVDLDSNTVVVGSRLHDSNTLSVINGTDQSAVNAFGNQNGSATIFTRSGTIWSSQAYLKAPNSSQNDEFGAAVAISGTTVIVGSRYEDHSSGSVTNGADLDFTGNTGNDIGAGYVYYDYREEE